MKLLNLLKLGLEIDYSSQLTSNSNTIVAILGIGSFLLAIMLIGIIIQNSTKIELLRQIEKHLDKNKE